MTDDLKDRLMDHDFDGIQEYDNPIPLWLNLILFGTVVFSIFYYLYFQIGPLIGTSGWTVVEAYEQAKAENMRFRFAEIGELREDEATLVAYLQPEKREWLSVGQTVYRTHCQSCHAADGSGLVGPNLTNDYYKSVEKLGDLVTVIADGAGNGAMPGWRNRLHPNELILVAAYVASLRGQDLRGPRPPEGKVILPWPTAQPAPQTPPEAIPETTPVVSEAAPGSAPEAPPEVEEAPESDSTSEIRPDRAPLGQVLIPEQLLTTVGWVSDPTPTTAPSVGWVSDPTRSGRSPNLQTHGRSITHARVSR
jgi:cytochrome c oxidase cbb3-type subunit III